MVNHVSNLATESQDGIKRLTVTIERRLNLSYVHSVAIWMVSQFKKIPTRIELEDMLLLLCRDSYMYEIYENSKTFSDYNITREEYVELEQRIIDWFKF